MTKLSDVRLQTFIRTAGVALLVALFSGAACADFSPTERQSCVVDEECDLEGDLCFRGGCVTSCASDLDCSSGDICRSEVRAEHDDIVDVCVDDTGANNTTSGECHFDMDCDAAFPGVAAQCGIDGNCFIPEFSLLIRDTTIGAGADDGGRGADIAAIYLEDPATGAPVAWADTLQLQSSVTSGQNAPDGLAVPLAADRSCVDEPFEAATTSLGGQGGTLLVRFLEEQLGETVSTPPSSWNVVIVEWGENCPGGEIGEPDSYNVFACAAAAHKSTVPDRDCGEFLASAATGGRLTIAAEQK